MNTRTQAGLVDEALEAVKAERELGRMLPEMPQECRERVMAGIRAGDRLDVAVLKLDAALTRSNAINENCAEWYADLRDRLLSE